MSAPNAPEQTRPTVRMRVTIEGYYDAPIDPNVYEGTTDPHEMARIDAQNPLDAILGLMGEPQVRIEPAPIPVRQQAEGDREFASSEARSPDTQEEA